MDEGETKCIDGHQAVYLFAIIYTSRSIILSSPVPFRKVCRL